MPRVENPTTLFIEVAADLYNRTAAKDLPTKSGDTYGIDRSVWKNLIALTRRKMSDIGFTMKEGEMKGLCIYGAVIAAKFLRHRAMIYTTNMVRVTENGCGDHYFAVASHGQKRIICDITSSQFQGPDWLVGTLAEIGPAAQTGRAFGMPLAEAYKVGARADTFVI